MGKNGFEDLVVWQNAKKIAVLIYKLSNNGSLNRDLGLRDQLRRSAVSIASNLAEGDERNSNKESVRFFNIAKGSLAELRTQLQIAYEVGYLKIEDYENMRAECEQLGKMIGSIIKVRQGKIKV